MDQPVARHRRHGTALAAAAPAQAAGLARPEATSTAGCPHEAQRFTFTPVQEFFLLECWATPGAVLLLDIDGFHLIRPDGDCHARTAGRALYGIFNSQGLFVYDFDDNVVWRTPPSSQYHARLILRGGDGSLLIRNQLGQEIWRLC